MSELYKSTLAYDIKTSGYSELAVWCGRLGLETEGSADVLRKRLADHYGVSLNNPDRYSGADGEEASGEEDGGGKAAGRAGGSRLITIESAENLEYFTIEQIDENYVRLAGKVVLVMKDEKTGDEHRISADSIIFNFTENFLTAGGNIRYELNGKDKSEQFSGEKITFNVESWEGLFSKGVSEEEKEVEKGREKVTFYFKGDRIIKTEDNKVMLQGSSITSCGDEDPHFMLKASKVWMLSSEEWAIFNGLLYIGRVPLLYIPGFIKPGDSMWMNPVMGYMNRSGYFLQTTTYLVGEKEKEEDSGFSFLQSGDAGKYMEPDGLFLAETENPGELAKDLQDFGKKGNYLKVMLDAYSVLGFYCAAECSMRDLGIFNKLDVFLAAGRSRKIGTSANGYYYLFRNDDGTYGSVWDNSYFLGLGLPFRYGFDVDLDLDTDWMSFKVKSPLYSDPDFLSDFSNRNENLDIAGLLGFGEASDSGTSSSLNNYNWSADLSLWLPSKVLTPWITEAKLNTLSSSMLWKSRSLPSDWTESTAEKFYYSDNYVLPKVGITLKGKLPDFTAGDDAVGSGSAGKAADSGLKAPWSDEPEDEERRSAIGQDTEFKLPDFREDLKLQGPAAEWRAGDYFVNSLSYSIAPELTRKKQFDTDGRNTPAEMDGSTEYEYLTSGLDASLAYTAKAFKGLFSLNESLVYDWNFDEHTGMDSLTEAEKAKYLLEDKQKTGYSLKNRLAVSLKPFIFADDWKNTVISYNLDCLVYGKKYSTAEGLFIEGPGDWDREDVSRHNIKFDLKFGRSIFSQSLIFSAGLPPVYPDPDLTAKTVIGPFESEIKLKSVTDSAGVVKDDPLSFTGRYRFEGFGSLSNTFLYNFTDFAAEKNTTKCDLKILDGDLKIDTSFTYDIRNGSPEELTAKINFKDAYLSFDAGITNLYSFDDNSGWLMKEDKNFQPKDLKLGIKTRMEPEPFWKNRINFKTEIDATLAGNMIKFTESRLDFTLKLDFSIFEFLDLKITSVSENLSIYRYFPGLPQTIGAEPLNPLEDLLMSFNFFNVSDRYKSNFNLKTISVSLVHDLHDWDLNFTYSGKPYINNTRLPISYDWENKFTIMLKWKGVPEIKASVNGDKGNISF